MKKKAKKAPSNPLEARLLCACGDWGCEHLTADQKRDFYSGAYEMARLLLTSPRMNRPQREIIEEVAGYAREHLEGLGVGFQDNSRQVEDARGSA